jgi:hypothetical protein
MRAESVSLFVPFDGFKVEESLMKLQRWFDTATALSRMLSIGMAALCMATFAHAANTVQDFTAIFPEDGGDDCVAPPLQSLGAVEILPYWDGKGVQLTPDAGGLNTGVAMNQLVSGAYDSLQIDFQLQITPGANAGADGIGFAYAAASNWGVDNCTAFPDWGTSEEPSMVNSLGVGFDNYNNGAGDGDAQNSVSLHWNGAMLASVSVDDFDPIYLESGDELQASVLITPSGTGSNVSVTLVDLVTGDPFVAFENEFVEGLQPYDGRPVFKARTGGESAEQAIDNVTVTLTPVGGGAPTTITENFESFDEGPLDVTFEYPPNPPLVGGTPYTEFQGGEDPPVRLISDGGATGEQPAHMQLTSQAGNLLNSIAFDKTSDVADNIQASFKMRMEAGGTPADGVSFLLLDAGLYGDDGELNAGFSEEPNLAGALAIGFDNYDNAETGGNNHVSLHWDGAQVGENFAIDPAEFALVNGEWNDIQVIATEVEGGMNVTVVITDGSDGSVITPFLDEFVPGASFPDSARAAFGARTGGANSFQLIDDVLISWTGGGGLLGDFNLNGSLDLPDINDLTGQSASGANTATYDLNGDALVNEGDIGVWINDLFNSWVGDANLDGEFNSADLVNVLASGTYEADIDSVWETGDFNGDGRTTSGDLVSALAGGGYEAGPRAAVAAVPEPAGCTLLLLGSLMFVRRRR